MNNYHYDDHQNRDFDHHLIFQCKQGNYSLRRPPKLIIPQIIIEQTGLHKLWYVLIS